MGKTLIDALANDFIIVPLIHEDGTFTTKVAIVMKIDKDVIIVESFCHAFN